MNIAINGLLLKKEKSGVEQVIFGLMNQFANDNGDNHDHKFTYILAKHSPLISPIEHSHFRTIETNIAPSKRFRRIFWENFFLPFVLKNQKIDLYHSLGYVLPLFSPIPSVVTIHDIIAIRFPQWCKKSNVLYYKIFLPYAVKNAAKVITISQTVKEELIKYLKVPDKKITVIYPGINNSFKPIEDQDILVRIRKKYSLPEKFILFLGNIEPKKNLKRLIDSFSKVKTCQKIEHKLVIAGKKGWKYSDVFKTVKDNNLIDDVIFTGYCQQKDLPAFYNLAEFLVFPSLYEGFGIPPLEAMACGTPVLASNQGALPETTGGCALLINPEDVDDIADGITNLLFNKDLRENLVQKGKKWVRQFTWEKAVLENMKVYKEVSKQKIGTL